MLLLPLLIAAQVQVAEEKTVQVPRTWLWPGVTAATRLEHGGQAGAQLALSYRLVDWLEPEALASIGVYGDPHATQMEIVDRFSFGARLLYPIEHVRPFLWLALHHEHQATAAAIMNDPIATTLGFSNEGVLHKTGAEAALGVDLRVLLDSTPVIASLRIGAVALPSFGAHGHGDQVLLFADIASGLPLLL